MKDEWPSGPWWEPLEEWDREKRRTVEGFDPRSVDWRIGLMFPTLLLGKRLGSWIKD